MVLGLMNNTPTYIQSTTNNLFVSNLLGLLVTLLIGFFVHVYIKRFIHFPQNTWYIQFLLLFGLMLSFLLHISMAFIEAPVHKTHMIYTSCIISFSCTLILSLEAFIQSLSGHTLSKSILSVMCLSVIIINPYVCFYLNLNIIANKSHFSPYFVTDFYICYLVTISIVLLFRSFNSSIHSRFLFLTLFSSFSAWTLRLFNVIFYYRLPLIYTYIILSSYMLPQTIITMREHVHSIFTTSLID
ncbi:protein E48E [Elephant endotheliotropic herpesvirus 5B]|nr:protein E48E [Elephant endotheliotropic herpesvirus 5B]